MRKTVIALMLVLAAASAGASEIVKIPLSDGETLTGKLDFPPDGTPLRQLVVFIAGTGPNTYLNRRKIGQVEFNYFDLFVQEFGKRGAAFFAYNRRGVDLGDEPPFYDRIDKEKYKKYLPKVESQDIGTVLAHLKKDPRMKDAKVILLGWSEGTMLAAMAAEDKKNPIDALFLAGYANDNLSDIIKWQLTGGSSMVNVGRYFDADHDGAITREEYESSAPAPAYMRANMLQNAKFDDLNVNKDDRVDREDFRIINAPKYAAVLKAIETGDDDWIWANFFRVTTAWLKEYFALEANKTRLLRIDIPVFIFHGEEDASVPVAGVVDIKSRFEAAGKTNLKTYVFKGHDHDLNYLAWPLRKSLSEGMAKIFDSVSALSPRP
jgi:pimeloyl-ACP methyl ester carboxylesterase